MDAELSQHFESFKLSGPEVIDPARLQQIQLALLLRIAKALEGIEERLDGHLSVTAYVSSQ